MCIHDRSRFWGTIAAEQAEAHPAAHHITRPSELLVRALDVEADTRTVFRWICQLSVAPYSYDWIDNLGRRSPRTLTPYADQLEVGDRFLIGRIVELLDDSFVTVVSSRSSDRIFGGPIVLTYSVRDTGDGRSRLLVHMAIATGGRLDRVRMSALAWGDLVMMRKQLLTLKQLAERDAAGAALSGRDR